MRKSKTFAFVGLLAVVAICGTILTAVTHDKTYFEGALGVVGVLGFWTLLTSE